MQTDRAAPVRATGMPGQAFARGRAAALDRLVRAGVPLADAEAWVDAWDATTAGLVDFRHADDFWLLGYRYAREEHARGFRPPLIEPSDARPRPAPGQRDEQAHAS